MGVIGSGHPLRGGIKEGDGPGGGLTKTGGPSLQAWTVFQTDTRGVIDDWDEMTVERLLVLEEDAIGQMWDSVVNNFVDGGNRGHSALLAAMEPCWLEG